MLTPLINDKILLIKSFTNNLTFRSDWDLHNTQIGQTLIPDSCDCENVRTTSIIGEQ